MAQSCPLSFQKTDETIARINSFFVVLLLIAFLFYKSNLILIYLALEYLIKLNLASNYSLMNTLAIFIRNKMNLKSEFVDSGAKHLAMQFGFIFSIMLIVLNLIQINILFYPIFVIYLSCAVLELLFNYCVGCKIYYIYQSIKQIKFKK